MVELECPLPWVTVGGRQSASRRLHSTRIIRRSQDLPPPRFLKQQQQPRCSGGEVMAGRHPDAWPSPPFRLSQDGGNTAATAAQRSVPSVPVRPIGKTMDGALKNVYLNKFTDVTDVWKKEATTLSGFSQADDSRNIAIPPPLPPGFTLQQKRLQGERSLPSLHCRPKQSCLVGQPLQNCPENRSDQQFNRAVGGTPPLVSDTRQQQNSQWDCQETLAQRQLAMQDSAIVRSGREEGGHPPPEAALIGPSGQANTWAEKRYAAQSAAERLYPVQTAAEEHNTVQAAAEERYTVQADILSWLAARWAETASQLAESHLVWPHKVVYYQPTY
jgi:hypothetical protein